MFKAKAFYGHLHRQSRWFRKSIRAGGRETPHGPTGSYFYGETHGLGEAAGRRETGRLQRVLDVGPLYRAGPRFLAECFLEHSAVFPAPRF